MKIGLCSGCFDLYHEGHEYFLREAQKHCDLLIIGLNTDASVRRLKGRDRPIESFEDRLYTLDDVLEMMGSRHSIVPFEGDHFGFTEMMNPDVVIRGWDQASGETILTIPIIRIGKGPDISTTSLAAQRSFK